jgi:hypothetical protein
MALISARDPVCRGWSIPSVLTDLVRYSRNLSVHPVSPQERFLEFAGVPQVRPVFRVLYL